MIQVKNFGIHWDGSVAWLQQGRGGSNFIGLGKKTPFQNPKGMCNHLVPPAAPIPDRFHWDSFIKIHEDPLVNAMLPVPRDPGDRAFYVEDPHDDLSLYIACLSRLSSPIHSVMRPAWMIKGAEMEREMNSTNIQPWVITQITAKENAMVEAISKATNYLPRTVIMTGSAEIPVPRNVTRIVTKIRNTNLSDLMTLPLENIGSTLIRRYARREDLFAMIEPRKVRRDRLLQERKPTP